LSYTFYCNRADAGTDLRAGFAREIRNITSRSSFIVNLCSYEAPGAYTAKVIVQSGSQFGEGRVLVTVFTTTGAAPPAGAVPSKGVVLVLTKNLYFGVRDDEVQKLQAHLKLLGYFTLGETTTFFGRLTEEAVKKYQCAMNLVCSGDALSTGYGVVGPKTRAAFAGGTVPTTTPAVSKLSRYLFVGASGDDVKYLQERLQTLGFFPKTQVPTGYFGQITLQAVRALQCAKNIVCSGDAATTGYGGVGPKTRGALQ
jgi:peptidoglycan hydrolase-like protein with peptidoglycan-binding domain